MKKDIVKIIVTGTLVIVVTVGGITTIYKKSEYEQEQLKIIQQVNEQESRESEILDMYFQEIIEKNKSNVELIIYDTEFSSFRETLQEEAWFNNIEMDINIQYKYKASIDLTQTTVTRVENKNVITVPKSAIKISSIEYGKQELVANTNLFNSFKGNTIEELSNQALSTSKSAIEQIVINDFNRHYNSIIGNLQAKLEYFYGQEGKYMEVEINEM